MFLAIALLASTAAPSGPAVRELVTSLLAQAAPCWHPSADEHSEGAPMTFVEVKLREDGRLASRPAVIKQTGANASDQRFAADLADKAVQAVTDCAPYRLPADLYRGGWDDFNVVFHP